MKTYAFVFARGGSKGLPGKNVKLLNGKPLLQYSIETAQQSLLIDQVFVSTDDSEIAQVAKNCGAILIERPKSLATDTSPEWLSWQHAVKYVEENYGRFSTFVSLPATSPLRSVDDVNASINKLENPETDICISVTEASRSPFFNMVRKNHDNFYELVNKPEKTISRRQDAPVVYDMTTVVYATRPEFIKSKSGLFQGNVDSVIVPKERAIDIDDLIDFRLAESILREERYE